MLLLDSMNETAMCEKLVNLSKASFAEETVGIQEKQESIQESIKEGISNPNPNPNQEGIQASFVAQYFDISIILAKEILIVAENRGLLCRDDSIGGLAFYPNKFMKID
jgi:ESCRT-II complex subunit VPS36